MGTEELREFEVVKSKIKDNTGEYVKAGGKAMLNKATAEFYHKKGFIRVSMDRLFEDAGTNRSAKAASSDNGPDEAVANSGSGADDKGAAGQKAEADSGTGETEAGEGRPSHRRRGRASS